MSNPYAAQLPTSPDLTQQRKRAKELLKSIRDGDAAALARLRYAHPQFASAPEAELQSAKLHDAQLVIAREFGFASWTRMKEYILDVNGTRQPPYRMFETDIDYYRGRASGFLSMLETGDSNALRLVREFHPRYANATDAELAATRLTQEDAELIQAREHGFGSWSDLASAVEALKADPSREPFRLAFEAIEAGDDMKLSGILEQHPSLANASGTNGNQLLHFTVNQENARLASVLLEAGADPDASNNKGSTPLTQAAYRGSVRAIALLLEAGASVTAEAYGDGGTPLAFALFWGHREAAEMLAEVAVVPRNLRVAAGLGRLDIMQELFDEESGVLKPEAGYHRGFYRPHSGFPSWRQLNDRQEILDEALGYAARSGRIEAMSFLTARGADVNSAPYQATPLVHAVLNGHLDAMNWLLDNGADINRKCGYGEPRSATPLHFAAAWGGQLEAAKLLVERGADLTIREDNYNALASGWANHFDHKDIEALLSAARES